MPGTINAVRASSPAPEQQAQEKTWGDTAKGVAREAAAFTARNAVPAMVGYVAGHAVSDYMHAHHISLTDYLPGHHHDTGFAPQPAHPNVPHLMANVQHDQVMPELDANVSLQHNPIALISKA